MEKGKGMKEFYNSNADFKFFVDKYCKKHKCTVEEALKHGIVKGVYVQHKEKATQSLKEMKNGHW